MLSRASAVLLFAMTGCAATVAPAMKPAAESRLAESPAGSGRVVFTRASSGCDTFDHAVVVDEHGSFVGTLAPGTAFAVSVPVGRHAFFVWPGMDLRSEKTPEFHPVSVADVDVAEHTTRSLKVAVTNPNEGRGRCFRYAVFQFQEPRTNDAQAAVAGLKIMEPDAAAGQAYLRENKELIGAYFLMAHDILDKRRAATAAAKQQHE